MYGTQHINYFPQQVIPRSKKTKKWREQCVRFADGNSVMSNSVIRNTMRHKKINYDLLNGKLNMDDLTSILEPSSIDYGDNKSDVKKIQHYPIMNKYLQVLVGEELQSNFNYKVVCTNPTTISDIAEKRKNEMLARMQEAIEDMNLSDELYQQQMQKIQEYYTYTWQDLREMQANAFISHQSKEQNFPLIFNNGFIDVLAIHEEIYQVSIEGGEVKLRKLNPLKISAFGMGYSNRIEDADMIVLEDYWSLGRIVDTYYEQLSKKDLEYLENLSQGRDGGWGSDGQYMDPRNYFKFGSWGDDMVTGEEGQFVSFANGMSFSDLPYDIGGNIRVLQVYWKSKRKIKEVKKYDEVTGKAYTEFHTEDYICNEDLGEEAKNYWINQAWCGTMIGAGEKAIFVDCGPCKVQYNTITNPSRCHFGIIGTIYNINESRPYSMVDMMKPLNYMYDATYYRLNNLVASNMGKVIQLNKSMLPKGWTMDTYIHYLKNAHLSVIDPMKEGTIGAAKGKLAGMFNMPPVIDLELGHSIANMIQLLEFTDANMAKMIGMTPQRVGEIQNRETVGGVERATMQSSHATRWWFACHDDTKKRVITAVIEADKICYRGRSIKFKHILPDFSEVMMEIDGTEFAESDYGLVVDNGYDTQILEQSIQQMSQAAMQNGRLLMSSYFKILQNTSLQEKIRILETNERESMQREDQQAQQNQQLQQQQLQARMQAEQAKMEHEAAMNTEDNETKIVVEQLKLANANNYDPNSDADQARLSEDIRQFDATLDLQNRQLEAQIAKFHEDNKTKLQIAKLKPNTNSNSNR